MARAVSHKYFEWFIIIVIIWSSVMLVCAIINLALHIHTIQTFEDHTVRNKPDLKVKSFQLQFTQAHSHLAYIMGS